VRLIEVRSDLLTFALAEAAAGHARPAIQIKTRAARFMLAPYIKTDRQNNYAGAMLQDPGGREPAPEPLRLVQQFVNTVDTENGIEELSSPADLQEVLERLGLLEGKSCSYTDLRHALEVREALRRMLLGNNGEKVGLDGPALERAAERARLTVRFSPGGGSALVPQASGVDGALGRILAVVHDAQESGTWERLKACRRDICHWIFFDRSKNRSSTWCAMAVCGNRTKKRRAYRRSRAP
jgi:predicted RNA-binding Zn ribbon-like protein